MKRCITVILLAALAAGSIGCESEKPKTEPTHYQAAEGYMQVAEAYAAGCSIPAEMADGFEAYWSCSRAVSTYLDAADAYYRAHRLEIYEAEMERLEAIQDSLEAIQDSLETAAAAAEFGLTAEEYEDSLRATLNLLF